VRKSLGTLKPTRGRKKKKLEGKFSRGELNDFERCKQGSLKKSHKLGESEKKSGKLGALFIAERGLQFLFL